MNLPEVYDTRAAVPQLAGQDASFFREADDQITVSYLLALLKRRIPILLLTAALCIALGLLLTLASPRVFNAASDVVLITNQTELVPGAAPGQDEQRLRAEDVETQIQLISSREMASQVFDELDLENDPQFVADVLQPRSTVDNLKASIGFDRRSAQDLSNIDPAKLRDRAIGYLTRAVEVRRLGNSFTLRIAVQDSEAGRAALLANSYARLYTTDDARQRAQRNATAARVLGERLEELREQANDDFAAVQGYRVRNGLLSSSTTTLAEGEISTYNQQIASARAEAAQASQALAAARSQLRGGGAGNVGQATSSPVVSSLRAQRAQLTTREADLARRYLDRHPELITVREQIASIDQQISNEVTREIRALEAQSQAASGRLASLQASRGGARAELSGDNTALVGLTDLERKADSSQALYQSYLQRFNEVMAGSGAEQPSARLISIAEPSVLPISPNWPLMMGLSVVVGLVLGALLAILTELAYRGMTTLDDIESKLGLNALGFIPDFKSVKPHGATPLDTVRDYPDGAFAESLRNILVSVGRASTGRCEVIAVTSAIPGEGKTTVSASMGRALATANQSVVVVDCDIIRSQLSRMFDLDNGENGLSEALANPSDPIAQYQEADSSMRILPITRPFRKGERLTESGRLQRVIARLREEFDFVILDCPPVLPIAEAREIVALADHVVLTVAWRQTTDKIVQSWHPPIADACAGQNRRGLEPGRYAQTSTLRRQ